MHNHNWNDIRKWIIMLMALMALTIAVYCAPNSAVPAEKPKAMTLAEWVFNTDIGSAYFDSHGAGDYYIAYKHKYVEPGEHWPDENYTMHWLVLWPMIAEPYYFPVFSTTKRTDMLTPGYNKTMTCFKDYNMDDIADDSDREFYVVTEDRYILYPDYPEGFVNREWYHPSEELYQAELNYWWELYNKEMNK